MLTREPSLYFSVLLLEMKIEMWSSAKIMHEHLILTISLNRINPEKLKRQKAAMRHQEDNNYRSLITRQKVTGVEAK